MTSAYGTEKKERFLLYNSLAVLIKAVEGERTTVDLRNEASINGIIEQADGFMNILMKDCVFTDPRGDSYPYEIFFVQARNIRYVHIPTHMRIIPSIKDQLAKLSSKPITAKTRTHKTSRAMRNQAQGLADVEKILQEKAKKEENDSDDQPKPSTSKT